MEELMSSHRDGVGPVAKFFELPFSVVISVRRQMLTWIAQVQGLILASYQLAVDALAGVYQDALAALHKVDDVPRVGQHVLAVAHAVHRDVGGEGVPDVLVQVGLNLALLKLHGY